MLCPYCIDEFGYQLACSETALPNPERLNNILVKTGYWECDRCDWTKAIYKKQPIEERPQCITINCHCCRDSGEINFFLVQKFLMEDYTVSDPPVPCRRCQAGLKILHGWDIATKADCDRIHKLEISKAFTAPPEPEEVQAKIIELATKF